MIPDIIIYVLLDILFHTPKERLLNFLSYVTTLILFVLPWTSLLDEMGLSFISLFMQVLWKGFCPFTMVVTNFVQLVLHTVTFTQRTEYQTLCDKDNLFLYEKIPFLATYITLFFFMKFFTTFIYRIYLYVIEWGQTRDRPCNGKNCVHYRNLEKLQHFFQKNTLTNGNGSSNTL